MHQEQVILLGCYHEIQGDDYRPEHQADVSIYREAIKTAIDQYRISLVGEEQPQKCKSWIRGYCEENGVTHLDVDIPQELQDRINHVYEGAPCYDPWKDDAFKIDPSFPEYREAWGLVREFHMYRAFLEVLGGNPRGMLVCGTAHLRGFERLLSGSYRVITVLPHYANPNYLVGLSELPLHRRPN